VDPTAAVAPERIYDTLEDRIGEGSASGALLRRIDLGDLSDWMRRGWNNWVLGFNTERQQRLLQSFGIRHLDGQRLVLVFALSALLALAWMTWLLARGERQRDPLLRAWHTLGARYAKVGLAREAHEHAPLWAERVVKARPQSQALIPLSRRFADARYATGIGDPTLAHDLRRHHP
jgi:hypothetical protein